MTMHDKMAEDIERQWGVKVAGPRLHRICVGTLAGKLM
jgi:hypothetical protein